MAAGHTKFAPPVMFPKCSQGFYKSDNFTAQEPVNTVNCLIVKAKELSLDSIGWTMKIKSVSKL